MWALMEMGILEDHRHTNNPLSYKNLTETGRHIYELMKNVRYPPDFFEHRTKYSWDMKLNQLCPQILICLQSPKVAYKVVCPSQSSEGSNKSHIASWLGT